MLKKHDVIMMAVFVDWSVIHYYKVAAETACGLLFSFHIPPDMVLLITSNKGMT